MYNSRKLVLVGTGMVGMSMAYDLEIQGLINELVLIDINKDKAIGEAMDLSHGLSCAPSRMVITAGDYPDCHDADIVVITAGVAQKPGETRLELAERNSSIVKDITEKVMASGFNGVFLVATNPVDLMSYVVYKTSGLPASKVIGSGTVLDSARLRHLIASKVEVSPKNVHAFIMGEHGDSSFAVWSHSYIGAVPLCDLLRQKGIDEKTFCEEAYKEVQQSAYDIINKKGATYYAIGMALTTIVKAIINNEREVLTVSTYLGGKYGHDDIFIGVPAIVNHRGAKDIFEIPLSEDEKKRLDESVKVLEDMKNKLGI